MTKRMILALLLILVLAVTSGCSLIVKDPEVDKQTVVLEVNGTSFTKGEVQPLVEEELIYQEYLYTNQYGMSLDTSDPEIVAQVQELVLESLTQQAVVDHQLAEGGYLNLPEEEMNEAQESVETTYQTYVDAIVASEFTDSELSEEEKRAAAVEWMAENGDYPTRDEMLENEIQAVANEKLYQEIVAGVTVSDEEIRAAYDERVSAARADYEMEPQYFDMDVSDELPIYYYPAGYRYVKHILISLAEEDQAALDTLLAQLEEKQQELSSLQEALAIADESAMERLMAQHDQLEEELIALENAYANTQEAAYAALEPKVMEVQAKIEQGEDFDLLIAQYGSDPGMQVEPAMTDGYLVGESSYNYVDAFREGALALEKIGDVSEPVRSDYGVHIIRYVSDVKEGPASFDDVQEMVREEVLTQKQDEAYYSMVDTWVREAQVKVYPKRLAD